MVAPLSDVPQEGSSVFSLFSLIKLHLAFLPLASSYSRVAVSSVFCAQNIFFAAQTINQMRLDFAYSGCCIIHTHNEINDGVLKKRPQEEYFVRSVVLDAHDFGQGVAHW